MSNPAVITLSEVNTSLGNFRVEDNIGEAIHLHLGEIRIDLTINELFMLSDELCEAVQSYMINIPGFDINTISKEFFFQKANVWKDLIKVKREKVNLCDLRVDTFDDHGQPAFLPLPNSRVVKALNGNNEENELRKENNYFGQTNQDRVDMMLKSIKKMGYPYKNQYIVLFNDSNRIVDGQHRAACLYYLYGNIEVDIVRMYFKNGLYSPQNDSTLIRRIFCWDKERIHRCLGEIKRLVKKILNKEKSFAINQLIKMDKKKYKKKRT